MLKQQHEDEFSLPEPHLSFHFLMVRLWCVVVDFGLNLTSWIGYTVLYLILMTHFKIRGYADQTTGRGIRDIPKELIYIAHCQVAQCSFSTGI